MCRIATNFSATTNGRPTMIFHLSYMSQLLNFLVESYNIMSEERLRIRQSIREILLCTVYYVLWQIPKFHQVNKIELNFSFLLQPSALTFGLRTTFLPMLPPEPGSLHFQTRPRPSHFQYVAYGTGNGSMKGILVSSELWPRNIT